jgi:hypothetical protein
MNNYYVYVWLRPNLFPYYVGKGKDRRDTKAHGRRVKRPSDRSLIIRVASNLTEQEAFDLEKHLISEIGRKDLKTGMLLNATDGGEGASGYKHKPKAIEKIREAQKGPNPDKGKSRRGKPATNLGVPAWNKGKPHTEEHKANLKKAWEKRKSCQN